jgi:acyl-CoA reductase-like NAD-dependent aldehyde dehydrogenase
MGVSSIEKVPLAERVRRCRQAQEMWRQQSIHERLRCVKLLRRLLVDECNKLCEALALDVGKSSEEAIGGDLLPLADALLFLEREAGRLLKPKHIPRRLLPLWLWPQRDTVHRRPRGVVGIIGTWNYPLFLNGVQMAQALTAGNGVIWKPSEIAPLSACALHAIFLRAGYPPDLVQLLPAKREIGRELAEADIDHVVFTGASATGQALAATLGRRLVSSSLELSGCDAMFVLDDADAALAARAAWFGATVNRGQTCIAVRRACVQRAIYPAFIDALKPLVAHAPPLPQALPAQVEHAERLVQEAVAQGGCLLETAKTAGVEGVTCAPKVVVDARPEMALCREATFAPVMAVLPFDRLEDAVTMDHHCAYGLGASIFTTRLKVAAALAAQLRTGMVAVNDVIAPTAHPATPFGGVGRSGWGVTQGVEGLLEMTVPQVVSVRGGTFRPHYDLAAGTGVSRGEMVRALLAFGHGATWGQRIKGACRLAMALWRGN